MARMGQRATDLPEGDADCNAGRTGLGRLGDRGAPHGATHAPRINSGQHRQRSGAGIAGLSALVLSHRLAGRLGKGGGRRFRGGGSGGERAAERRKDIHVPLLFHRYMTVGAIEGELRVVDVSRARLEIAEPFKIEEKGPRAFQATMDDDIHDPDLHLTAAAKVRFFQKLEEELAGMLVKRIGSVIRMR